MIKADFHLHTKFSPDSQEALEAIVHSACEKKLTTICFTDHYEYDNHSWLNPSDLLDEKRYFDTIMQLKEANKHKLDIKYGIEFGMQPHIFEELTRMAQTYPFDFIIASSHMVEKIDVGFDARPYQKGKTQFEFYQTYFEEILRCIDSFDDFDVYGHIDYIIRYGSFEKKAIDMTLFTDVIKRILKKLIDKGKGIEINSSGIRYNLGHCHPKKDILALYKALGGEIITIGSDAHKSADVGFAFNDIEKLMHEIGFKYYCTFDKRQPKFHKI